MKKAFLLLFILSTVLVNAQAPAGYHLVWADEFNGTVLDTSNWFVDKTPRRKAFNSADAVQVADGCLKLSTYVKDGKIFTGFIGSFHKRDFKYGYFECRVKFQTKLGHWGAFWLMPYNICNADTAPNVCGTEIDVVEYFTKRGNRFQHALHWNNYKGNKAKIKRLRTIKDGYHTFAVLWTEYGYTFYVDGKKSWKTNIAVSHVAQPLLLSMEVDEWAGSINPATLPDAAYFDYVRVYQNR